MVRPHLLHGVEKLTWRVGFVSGESVGTFADWSSVAVCDFVLEREPGNLLDLEKRFPRLDVPSSDWGDGRAVASLVLWEANPPESSWAAKIA